MVAQIIECRDSYVYVVFRLNGVPCYVGKGKRGRWLAHFKKSHNRYLQRIVAKEGPDLPVIKVREGLTDAEANLTEIALIAAIGRHDQKRGPLVNLTKGGDGVVGGIRTPEQIERLRQSRIGRKHTDVAKEKVRQAFIGKPKTPEHSAAVSAAKRGKPGKSPSPETRSRQRASHLAKNALEPREIRVVRGLLAYSRMTEEAKQLKAQRMSVARKGKSIWTSEQRKVIGDRQRGIKRGPLSEEQKAKMRVAFKNRAVHPKRPESIAKQKATWAAKRALRETVAGQRNVA